MGLFSNLFGKKEQQPGKAAAYSQPFYEKSVQNLHQSAQRLGLAKKGIIPVPELSEPGNRAVDKLMNDDFLKNAFNNNQGFYYRSIFLICFEYGVVFANHWHESPDDMNSYVDEMIVSGPGTAVIPVLEAHLKPELAADEGRAIINAVFPDWMRLLDPYFNTKDVRAGLHAAYQLGISIILGELQ